jgi:hypothetical protein
MMLTSNELMTRAFCALWNGPKLSDKFHSQIQLAAGKTSYCCLLELKWPELDEMLRVHDG